MQADRKPLILVPTGIPHRYLPLGSHVCHFYYGRIHFLVTIRMFLRAGLENKEKCYIYMSPDMEEGFRTLWGKATLEELEGRLELLDFDAICEIYSSSERTLERNLEDMASQAQKQGFLSARYVGQTDAVLARIGRDRIAFVERITNNTVPRLPITVLCEYALEYSFSRFSQELLSLHPRYLAAQFMTDAAVGFQTVDGDVARNK